MSPTQTPAPPEWRVSAAPVGYAEAVAAMEQRVGAIRAGTAPELVWLLEHPPLYTAGTSADPGDLRAAGGLPVHRTGRGGQFTYHGPGQRVAYVLLDLDRRGRDLRAHVAGLEAWITLTLARFGVEGLTRPDRVGIWVDRRADKGPGHEDKIAAIGVRVRRWVTYHGVALNVDPDLRHFDGIVPCGIDDPRYGVTSLHDLGHQITMDAVDSALREVFPRAFPPGRPAPAPLPGRAGTASATSR
jgi:lipoyl(octanoyl) transferase